ncbi:MAG: DNA polymerase I [Candidatus Saccharibacteria bacterium]
MQFKQKILLVDGHALFHRAYHALPGLSNKDGFPTGAIYGFLSILFKAFSDLKPTHALVAFDLPGQTFRHKMSGDYKANRKPMESDLVVQLPKLQEVLTALKLPIYQKEGYEADDLIGIITRKTPKDILNIILTGDMDFLQVVNGNTEVYRLKTGISEMIIFDEDRIKQDYGITADQWLDYKALRGDASDNIPGVKGIGEKTALGLVAEFGSVKRIYEEAESHPEKFKPAVLNKLKEGRHYAFLSYDLAKIDCENGLEFDLEATKLEAFESEEVVKLFQELGMRSLLSRLPRPAGKAERKPEQSDERQVAQEPEKPQIVVDSEKEMGKLVDELSKSAGFALTALTDQSSPLSANLLGLSIASGGRLYYLPVKGKQSLAPLKEILENEKIEKYGYNQKSDLVLFKRYGVEVRGIRFDVMVAGYLLNPGLRSYDLEALMFSEFGVHKQGLAELLGKGRDKRTVSDLEPEALRKLACENADSVLRLAGKLKEQIREQGIEDVLTKIEMPLIPVLAAMEERGVLLDSAYLRELSQEGDKQIRKLEKEIHKQAGQEFNISSPIQLRDILFERLKIPTDPLRRRGKTGELSTAAGELEKLREYHPIIDLIFQYRELTKLKSTYLDALPELVREDRRLHTSFNQTIAATGRLSSSDPNLQNIPIRTDLGNRVRKAFVADKGFELVSLDYSQIELRIAASMSGDPEMIKIFKNGGDFHAATAARIFNVPQDQVTGQQRRVAKTINFSILYGVSAFGLSERTEMARAEAGDFIKRYYQVFMRLKEFIDEMIAEAHKNGLMRNPLGRIRYFPDIHSSNYAVRSAAERAAVNMPLQSLAADIMKLSMIEIDRSDFGPGCRLLLSVHDELVFEIRKGEEACVPKIKEIMENSYKLKVPVVAEAKIGPNWLDMKKVEGKK